DSKRQWYRYHALFAEALSSQLRQIHRDFIPLLHLRASRWYAEHDQITEAILHALRAQEWQWAADLIEQKSLPVMSLAWGASEYALFRLQDWLQLLPVDIISSRPHLCLACAQLLWLVTPHPVLEIWLNAAEARLATLLNTQTHEDVSYSNLSSETQQEQENLLGELITWHALLHCFQGDGQAALLLCQRASTLLSPQNALMHAYLTGIQSEISYVSDVNNAVAAVELGFQAGSLAQEAHLDALALVYMGATVRSMIGAGQLHEAQRLSHRAILLGTKPKGLLLPDVGWPKLFEAEVLREWNKLDAALSLVKEGISLCQQVESIALLMYLLGGYTMLLRICLSYGDLDAAKAAFQQVEQIGSRMNQPSYLYLCSYFTIVDQIRLWLACGEVDRATCWVAEREMSKQHGNPFASEREEVACVRVLLAKNLPDLALERLEPVLQRATRGQRWGYIIEMRLLQALAYHICRQEIQALDALSEALRLGEPEGYIRSFVDEGAPMESLLYQFRKRNRKYGPTPYLDTLLAAFHQETKGHVQEEEPSKPYQLPEPLSEREREILQLLASGASNQEIAQELVIAVDTVKRHASHIFSKLGVRNRMQAVLQARELGLLGEEV
ncbi:MAG TPA: LuxR C-terminal-related transcriptional regulator, partial [Ktedonobacteraceae bacterium]